MRKRATVGIAIIVVLLGAFVAWRSCRTADTPGGVGGSGSSSTTTFGPNGTKTKDGPRAMATLGGRVTNAADGKGIPNAIVSVASAELMAMFVRSGSPTAVAHTDANGVWTIANVRPGPYTIGATAIGFLPGTRDKIAVNVADDRKDLDIALTAGGTLVKGTVGDVGGGAIPAARITAHLGRREVQLGGTPDFVAITNGEGKYEITLPDGNFELEAEHDDYTNESERIDIEGQPLTVDFTLVPGAVVRGQVVARDSGKGVPGALVHAEAAGRRGGGGANATAFADEEGNFVLRSLDAGALEIKALGHGYASVDGTNVNVGIGEPIEGIRVLVDRAYSISGHTVRKGKTAEPIPGVTIGAISILTQQLGIALEPSAKDGAFEIVGVRPGNYSVFAVGEGSVPNVGVNVDVVDKDIKDIVIELESGVTIAGRVEPPKAGAEISIAMTAEIGPQNMFEVAKTFLVHGETDATGAFVLENVPSGSYKLTAEAKEGDEGTIPLTVTEQDQSGLVVKLDSRGTITGRVVDTNGKAAGGINVSASAKKPRDRKINIMGDGRRDGATSKADGTFTIVGLEAGPYRVAARESRFDFGQFRKPKQDALDKNEADVDVAAGVTKSGITLTVEAKDGVIQGVVIGPDHKPAADAWITARRAPEKQEGDVRVTTYGGGGFGQTTPVLTNADGHFTIGKLAKGTYDLVVEGPRGATHAEKPGIKTGESVTIELLSFGTLTGVVTIAGAPVPKYTIQCKDPKGEDSSRQIDAKDGAYSLERLAPGTYKCSVEGDAGTSPAVEVEVPAGPAKHDFALVRWATISGIIVSVIDKKPIAGVNVFAGNEYSSSNIGAMLAGKAPVTDPTGHFLIERVSIGPGQVVVMPKTGFTPIGSRDFTATEGQKLDIGTIEIVPPHDGDAGTFGLSTNVDGDKLLVDQVSEGGPALAAGVALGDRITAINGREISQLTPQLGSLLLQSGNMGVGAPAALTIDRAGTPVKVTLTSVKW